MSVINSNTIAAWQMIANNVSRQRPYPGRTATVFRGRKLLGEKVSVVRHQKDAYSDAFRYGGAGNLMMREMAGRSGFVCLVRNAQGAERWIKASYLACDYTYDHWSVALADAMSIQR